MVLIRSTTYIQIYNQMQRTMLSTLLVQLYLQALAEGEETKQKQLNAELANCLTR